MIEDPHRSAVRAAVRLLLPLVVALVTTLLGTGAASADPAPSTWAKLRMCESSDRYFLDTGNGYYGAYQFDLPTWRSVGGQGKPNLAGRQEQDFRALYLYRMRGWQPWECAGMLGLRNDPDARSKRIPLPPSPIAPTPVTVPPPWPGVVYAYGDCAPALRTFQLRMNVFGYDFDGTGCYYDKTRQAVLDLQRANGINDSGRLGPKTWHAAWEGRAPR
ncbi:transglycosylase [Amycolatopsis rhizosphaerae]|uniref:Transglycosylase n=1 Tax=Amycolatopsis rhizosphaerae TaxID=2053003 RepID=A0A558CM84_9PSEU|nr:transglycosylase family protein [Amycolatopsis rhizosphaerae]TVT49878.1 transglycosylase [Amycolatopsis rhizosphaerae]